MRTLAKSSLNQSSEASMSHKKKGEVSSRLRQVNDSSNSEIEKKMCMFCQTLRQISKKLQALKFQIDHLKAGSKFGKDKQGPSELIP